MTSNSEKLRSLFLAALMVFSVFAVTVTLSGGAAAQISGNSQVSTSQGDGAALDSGSTFYGGQDVYVNGLEPNTDYQVRTVDTSGDNDAIGNLRRTVESNSTGVAEFTLDGRLSEGDFVFTEGADNTVTVNSGTADSSNDSPSSTQIDSDSFEVVTQDLTAEFGDDTADAADDADTVEFDIASDVRNGYSANISADGLDTGDLNDIIQGDNVSANYTDDDIVTLTNAESPAGGVSGGDDYDFNFSGIDEGTYTFEVNVTDSAANDSATIEVSDTGDDTASINQSLIQGNRGEVVEIPVQMENTDTATVEIGDFTDDNYNMTVEVEDDSDDGVVVIEFNTYSAGAVDAGADPYDIEDNNLIGGVVDVKDDDDEILSARENGSFSEVAGEAGGSKYSGFNSNGVDDADARAVGEDVLDASEYDVRVEAGEHPYVSDDDDVATIDLSERSDDGVVFWTIPEDRAGDFDGEDNDERVEILYEYVGNNNITQSENVAIDDVQDGAVVQVQSSGLEGIFAYHLSDAGGNLDDRDAVYDAISAGGANENYASGNILSTGQPGGDYVAPFSMSIDDEDATANTEDSGDTLGTAIQASNDEYTVVTDEDNGTHFVVFEEIGNTLDADDGDNYAANFSMSDSDGDGLTDGSVTEEDTFETVNADGEINNGQDVTVTANEGQTLSAETNVAPGTEVVIRARSTSQTSGAPFLKQPTGVVQPDGTVEATGDFSDVEAGSNFTAQIRVGGTNVGDSVEGTVLNATAETPTEGTEVPETEEPTEPMETEEPTEPMETEMPTEEETTTGGSGPGFTAAIALIALIAAALLAVRRNN